MELGLFRQRLFFSPYQQFLLLIDPLDGSQMTFKRIRIFWLCMMFPKEA
jgi:hypothetical protein